MQDVVASAELFVEEAPGGLRRSVVVAVGRPVRARGAEDDGWTCRVKITAGRVDERVAGPDSLRALAAALDRVREHLAALRARRGALYAAPRGGDPIDPRDPLGSPRPG